MSERSRRIGPGVTLLVLLVTASHSRSSARTPAAGAAIDHTCLVLPGSWSNATRSFAIGAADPVGGLGYVSEVEGGAWHQRAAVHPTGPYLYVAASVEDGGRQGPPHVLVYPLDRGSCEMGPALQVVAPPPDTAAAQDPPSPTRRRYYGLEMHPNGRFLYQTTEGWREIRLFRVDDDGRLTFVEAYDVTRGGAHVCDHARRLEIHPDGRTLYSNCNNDGAGEGADYALQVWRIGDGGRLAFLEHQTTTGMDAGVFDPTVHPTGRWLYQPISSAKPTAPEGRGAYILIYHIAPDGRLRHHSSVRVADPDADTEDGARAAELSFTAHPSTVLVHPDGTHAYVTLHDQIRYTHQVVVYRIDADDGGLAHVHTLDTATSGTGNHNGGALATRGERTFLYTFLNVFPPTDGERPRGFGEQYEIGQDYRPVPLEPPVVPTGLVDARQPVVLARVVAGPGGATAAGAGSRIRPGSGHLESR